MNAKSLMNRCGFAAALLLLTGWAFAAEQGAGQLAPDALVKKVAEDVLKDLDANRAEYKKDPAKVRAVVDKYMLPHFDTRFAAQQVMARHWKSATPEQQKRFIDAFYQSLLQSYGDALVDFTPDRLKIFPYKGKPDDKYATVKSEIRRDDGSRIPVNYSLRKTKDGWKAFDVQIEGVSYVTSYQADFNAEFQQKGIEGVIKRLETQVASGTVQKPTAKAKPAA